ncbi:MAG: hypothetical protein EXR71_04640 [Myxococcales bacterium]|nr:hypothetical protein [Myxococcales bacterium]
MIVLLALACTDDLAIPLHFDGPAGAAWLPAGDDLPFDRAVGFVSNSRSGKIVPLDLVEGRLLTDDASASFLRASSVATGKERQLRDVAAFASAGKVMLWAVDVTGAVLVQAPYITAVGEDGVPVEVQPTASEPLFVDADGSADAPTITEVAVRPGYTTTEDWSIEYDGSRWWAKGSLSGQQVSEPVSGESYNTDGGELGFQLDGEASVGDRFEIRTDSQLVTWSLAGRPTALADDGTHLFVSVDGPDPLVGIVDPWTGAWLGGVALPVGASPWRMSLSASGELFVADARSPAFYRISFTTPADAGTASLSTIPTAAPVLDVAWQNGTLTDGTPFERVFVAPVGLQRVDVYDALAGVWFDPNPLDAEVAGVRMSSPISGLSASVGPVRLQQPTSWGAYAEVPSLTISTQDGFVFMLDATTGCAVSTFRGPHGPNEILDTSENFQYALLDDVGATSDVILAYDEATGEQVAMSDCPGLAPTELWTVTYDSPTVSWVVEGTISGPQLARAHEDQRYLSDSGAISFLLLSGTLPATDGDNFSFIVDRGVLGWSYTDRNEDGALTPGLEAYWEAPARPLAFQVLAGPNGGGWDDLDRKEMTLLPMENADEVARIHLDGGKADVSWE